MLMRIPEASRKIRAISRSLPRGFVQNASIFRKPFFMGFRSTAFGEAGRLERLYPEASRTIAHIRELSENGYYNVKRRAFAV